MSVRKRKWKTSEGVEREAWVVDYVDQEGDRHIETFERERDAKARAAVVRVDVDKGIHTAASKSITVAEAAEVWIKRAESEGRERSTIEQYRQHIRIHIVPRLGKIKLSALTAKTLEQFRDDLLANLSRPLARKVLTSVKSLLKVARYSHVAADISIGRDKRGQRKLEVGVDIPTPDEVKRLIAAAHDAKIACPITAADLVFPTALGEIAHHEAVLRSLEPIMAAAGVMVPIKDASGAAVLDKSGQPQLEPKYALHAFRHFFASWCINPKERGGRELPPRSSSSSSVTARSS